MNQSYNDSAGAGNIIQINHGGGWFTTYLHLQSRAVGRGQLRGASWQPMMRPCLVCEPWARQAAVGLTDGPEGHRGLAYVDLGYRAARGAMRGNGDEGGELAQVHRQE